MREMCDFLCVVIPSSINTSHYRALNTKFYHQYKILYLHYYQMEITFKGSGSNKGKQCQEILSIFKKLKLILPTKDRILNFYFDKKKFIITTYAARNLENYATGNPNFFIDYEFGQDMYSSGSIAGDQPYMFSFDIQDVVRMITHHYEVKMAFLKLQISSDISNGSISFSIPEQTEGSIPLQVQRIFQFPLEKDLNKEYISRFLFFEISDQFQGLKQIEDINYTCSYEVHEQGIYFKNYHGEMEGNKYLLKSSLISKYEPNIIKEKLKGNIYIKEAQNHMIQEIRLSTKKKYKQMRVYIILTHPSNSKETIKNAFIEVQASLAGFPKTLKRLICTCQITNQNNQYMHVGNQISSLQPNQMNLLKSEEPTIEGLRKIILNKWAQPRMSEAMEENQQRQRARLGARQIRNQMMEQTKTRKITYKIQEE